MIERLVNTRIVKTVYRWILPTAFLVIFVGYASFNHRTVFIGSQTTDFLLRLLISAWFCCEYIQLSNFRSYSHFPNIKWTRTDVGKTEKILYISESFLFSIFNGLFTWWIIRFFLPEISDFSLIIAFLNSLIICLPMASQYWVLKI